MGFCKRLFCLATLWSSLVLAQAGGTTVSYPAEFFRQWNPVTVADMIDRIPGISLALDSSGGNNNDRGLGNAENILINGRRLSGKDNDASAQLARISFDQVSHIEIIRGTSTELVGVRNQGQIVNIVTRTVNEMSVTVSSSLNQYQDQNQELGGALFVNGSRGNLGYRLSVERQPAYQFNETIEESVHGVGDFSPNDLRTLDEVVDQINQVFNSSLSWQLSPAQNFTLNLSYEDSGPPRQRDRRILDFNQKPSVLIRELEDNPASRDAWEVGADYNLQLDSGARLQLLGINNRRHLDQLRQRFRVLPDNSTLQDLAIQNDTVDTEAIYRAVYTRPLAAAHNLELGLERARTGLQTRLALARLQPLGDGGAGLRPVPIPNADTRIEEVRYEGFMVHHWQLNPRMKLESQLLYEVSEITQTGEFGKQRDFNFLRPKLDYRFDITSTLQLQLSAEKVVDQLNFNDFAASADPRDEDRDTVAGNPELRQQQSWRYTANLEYRLPQQRGVINVRSWYWDVSDAIGRVDVTRAGGPPASANGNIGDGEVLAIRVNGSYRPSPNLLLSAAVLARASAVIDPFTGRERRLVPNDRGNYSFNLRHTLPGLNLNYGLDYRGADIGNRPLYDIDRIDDFGFQEELSVFAERTAISSLGLVLRLDIINVLDRGQCNDRFRFAGKLGSSELGEVERRCTERGTTVALQLRGTF